MQALPRNGESSPWVDQQSSRITTAQYEETTWGARGWLAFQSQRLLVKLHLPAWLAVAYQIGQHPAAEELGLAACVGADPRDDAC